MQNLTQGQEFLCYFFIGSIICCVFDLFRASRYIFKTSDIVTYIEDGVFLLISTIIILFGIIYISSGILRFYIVLAICLGILTYSLTISKVCVIMYTYIFKAVKFVFNLISEIHL